MNTRLNKIIEMATSINDMNLATQSTDIDNTINFEYQREVEELYRGINKSELHSDIIELMKLLEKIERSHGKSSKGRNFILKTLSHLEKL